MDDDDQFDFDELPEDLLIQAVDRAISKNTANSLENIGTIPQAQPFSGNGNYVKEFGSKPSSMAVSQKFFGVNGIRNQRSNSTKQNIKIRDLKPSSCPSKSSSGFGIGQGSKKHKQTTLFQSKIKPTIKVRGLDEMDEDDAAEEVTIPPNLPCDHKYDPETVKIWEYPADYSIRSYQFKIVQKALFLNTLVCLPTGLGKTFIAAAVMHNFFKWFPDGKIIFMAPTKPLVSQQIDACYKITGIDPDLTIELTGTQAPATRSRLWKEKRVFFITPQILQNDLKNGMCTPEKFVCVIVDEAHRATGNYAYCTSIKSIYRTNKSFRILALSATPGSDINTVQKVVDNLKISRIEIRTEDSPDILDYIHQREKVVKVVELSEKIKKIQQEFELHVIHPFLNRLLNFQAIYERDPRKLSKYQVLMARAAWRTRKPPGMPKKESSMIEDAFGLLMSLYYAYELLLKHGITPFFKYLKENFEDPTQKMSAARRQLNQNLNFRKMLEEIESEKSLPTYSSHPKIEFVESIVLDHFSNQVSSDDAVSESRVMIFAEYRDAVEDIVSKLQKQDPILRVMSFLGQASKNGRGCSQKEQMEVLKKFQSGNYNVLVSTSIGEEGLDIGEVDLIICYDTQSSPVRMLQRMGRTGRKRDGKIFVLLTEGREVNQYERTDAQYKSIQAAIMSQDKVFQLFKENPLVLPEGLPKLKCKQVKSEAKVSSNLTAKDQNEWPKVFDNQNWEKYVRICPRRISGFNYVRPKLISGPLVGERIRIQESNSANYFSKINEMISTFRNLKSKDKLLPHRLSELQEDSYPNPQEMNSEIPEKTLIFSPVEESAPFIEETPKKCENLRGVKIHLDLNSTRIRQSKLDSKLAGEFSLLRHFGVSAGEQSKIITVKPKLADTYQDNSLDSFENLSDENFIDEAALLDIDIDAIVERTQAKVETPKSRLDLTGSTLSSDVTSIGTVHQIPPRKKTSAKQIISSSPGVDEISYRKSAPSNALKKSLFELEAVLSDSMNSDDCDSVQGRQIAKKRTHQEVSEEDEDLIDQICAEDSQIEGFVVNDSECTEAVTSSDFHLQVSSPQQGMAYKMKFFGDVPLSQRFGSRKLPSDMSQYERDSFVVDDSDTIEIEGSSSILDED